MINTLSKTLGAQEKTQEIKQSPSMKIGTKPYARSRRNKLAEATGRWTGRWWLGSRDDRTLDRWLGSRDNQTLDRWLCSRDNRTLDRWLCSRGDRTLDRLCSRDDRTRAAKPTERREAASDRVQKGSRAANLRPDAWPASDQYIAGSTVEMTGRVRSGRFSVRSVAVLREFDPNGYFLSGAYKYNPQPAI